MDDLVDLINVNIKKDFVSLDRLRGLQGGVGSYLVVRYYVIISCSIKSKIFFRSSPASYEAKEGRGKGLIKIILF